MCARHVTYFYNTLIRYKPGGYYTCKFARSISTQTPRSGTFQESNPDNIPFMIQCNGLSSYTRSGSSTALSLYKHASQELSARARVDDNSNRNE
ncbi:hypothetical protein B0J17DRAFT_102913 [Rhizoctonia solani]|nr:hypothetical protein B0J17DRAFT_102913 [Rhizoctonia solani]